jgi:hypothetical protein
VGDCAARRAGQGSDRRLGWTARVPAVISTRLPRSRLSLGRRQVRLRAVAGPDSGHRNRVRHTGRTTCSCALLSSSCSPSGFRPHTFEAVLMPRPLVILRRHSDPGGDLQRLHRRAALHACYGSPSRSRFVSCRRCAPARLSSERPIRAADGCLTSKLHAFVSLRSLTGIAQSLHPRNQMVQCPRVRAARRESRSCTILSTLLTPIERDLVSAHLGCLIAVKPRAGPGRGTRRASLHGDDRSSHAAACDRDRRADPRVRPRARC